MDLTQLKVLDRLLCQNDYSDEVFAGMLPFVTAYVESLPRLREIPLGEVASATVMLAGGKR
ncbi:MAG TPA: hypothetical protein VNG11_01655 [Chloroflexota bacterium]|nr:hypothetical protein [Chloroflexota bacterium]